MIAKTERDKNRERMPNVADVIDQFNAFFCRQSLIVYGMRS